MLFCLSICDQTKRVILDQDYHGEVLIMIEAKTYKEARHTALASVVMDRFIYKRGYGWEARNN